MFMTKYQSRSRKLTYTVFKSYNSSYMFAYYHSFSNLSLRYCENHEPPLLRMGLAYTATGALHARSTNETLILHPAIQTLNLKIKYL